MVHRAASACAAGPSAMLAYLLFTPQPDGVPTDTRFLRSGLARLAAAMGGSSAFPIHVIEVAIRPTAAFERIRMLKKGETATGEAVRAALLGPPLFEFEGIRVETVGPVSVPAGSPPLV